VISLEQLVDGSASDRNFQKLMSLVLDTGGRSVGIRFGTGSVSFTASAASTEYTVAHGLGRTPVTAYATFRHATGTTLVFTAYVSTLTSTTIGVSAAVSSAVTGSLSVDWLVFG
jgi:hypothetical protein